MDFSIGKFNSPKSKRQLTQDDQKPQFSHFVPKINSDNQFKQKILLQNKALARKNSILMTKISDMETKVSDLIQQNIELRAINAKSEDQKRKWLEEKINIIEEGVSQRFSDMFQMLQNIRTNEGLPSSNVQLSHLMVGSSGENSTDKSVSFQLMKSPKKQTKAERRRRSLRRQSIYIAPPDPPTISEQSVSDFDKNVESFPTEHFELPQEINEEQKVQEGPNDAFYDRENPFQEQTYEQIEDIIQQHQAEELEQLSELEKQQEQEIEKVSNNAESLKEVSEDNESVEFSHASSLSPIRLLSPSSLNQKSQFMVYEDSPELQDRDDGFNEKISRLASGSVLDNNNTIKTSRRKKSIVSRKTTEKKLEAEEEEELSDEQKPLAQDTNKVKHTKSKQQKSNFIADESMPGSDASNDELSTRRSRTRGKQVSYAEPSLRAKMRRQSEKFVDATDEEAYDAYINNVLINRRKTTTPEEFQRKKEDNDEVVVPSVESSGKVDKSEPITHNAEEFAQNVKDSRESPAKPRQKTLIEQDNINITKRRKPLSTLNSNKIAKTDSSPMEKISLPKVKVVQEENMDEADLSVFDLVEEASVGVPKTTYKGQPDIKLKRRSSSGGRRHSMLL
jgi:shugoshin